VAEPITLADIKTDEKSWWCPGCGDFGVLAALQKSVIDLQIAPHEMVMVAGIGCSGKIGNYINSYNIHVVHGRTLPTAMGVKLANRDLKVLAVGGDGDGFAIGMGHFIHACRRNVDVTYLTMDNHIYGLTKGQNSPTSDRGAKVKTAPEGSIEAPVRPLQMALAAGATWVGQGFSSNQAELVELIKSALGHRGFSFLNVISPCVTYNKVNTYAWYKEVLRSLKDDSAYRTDDRQAAMARAMETDELVTGLLFRDDSALAYEDQVAGFSTLPLTEQSLDLTPDQWEGLLADLR
jgi:2-oxoglutarate ferredoxin oxidoreductase subunit beta